MEFKDSEYYLFERPRTECGLCRWVISSGSSPWYQCTSCLTSAFDLCGKCWKEKGNFEHVPGHKEYQLRNPKDQIQVKRFRIPEKEGFRKVEEEEFNQWREKRLKNIQMSKVEREEGKLVIKLEGAPPIWEEKIERISYQQAIQKKWLEENWKRLMKAKINYWIFMKV